jgi:hypothetical protein
MFLPRWLMDVSDTALIAQKHDLLRNGVPNDLLERSGAD